MMLRPLWTWQRWMAAATPKVFRIALIGTCKLNGVNPQAYLTDTLSRNVDMHSMSLIDDLMPWNFTPAIPTDTRQEG